TGRLERSEHADEVLGPDGVEAERVDDLDRLVTELGGERAAERHALHLAREPLLVRTRMRPEDDATATIVRRADGALAGAAGALLGVRVFSAPPGVPARPGVGG